MFVLGEYNNEIDIKRLNLRYIAPEVAAALIAGGTSIVGNVINRYADEQMVDKQNAYNDPSAVLQRMYAAGLNPAAVAQTVAGNAGTGNMAPASYDNITKMLPSDMAQTMMEGYDAYLKGENTKADTENINADTEGQIIDNVFNNETLDTRIQQAKDSGAITAADAEKARLYLAKYPEILDTSVEEMHAKVDNIRTQTSAITKNIDKIDQEIIESKKLCDKYEQDIKTAKSQEDKNRAEIAYTNEKKRGEKLQNDKQEMENDREKLTGSATGLTAVYFEKEKKDGTEAADKWLDEAIEIGNKVIEGSSEATAKGRQNVEDETPQGSVRKMYQEQMDKELADVDEEIAEWEKVYKRNGNPQAGRRVQSLKRRRNDIIRGYRNKMRRVEKPVSVGGSAYGFGVNAGG